MKVPGNLNPSSSHGLTRTAKQPAGENFRLKSSRRCLTLLYARDTLRWDKEMSRKRQIDKEAYLASDGANCPYCSSGDIKAGSIEPDGNIITQYVECLSCHRVWTDIFVLTDVIPG